MLAHLVVLYGGSFSWFLWFVSGWQSSWSTRKTNRCQPYHCTVAYRFSSLRRRVAWLSKGNRSDRKEHRSGRSRSTGDAVLSLCSGWTLAREKRERKRKKERDKTERTKEKRQSLDYNAFVRREIFDYFLPKLQFSFAPPFCFFDSFSLFFLRVSHQWVCRLLFLSLPLFFVSTKVSLSINEPVPGRKAHNL